VRFRNISLLICPIVALAAGSASAAQISQDLFASGDGLITLDTGTNLEWLDVTETFGLSADQVLAGAGGWVDLGFTLATTAQVTELFQNAGGTNIGSAALTAQNYVPARTLMDLLGGCSACQADGFTYDQLQGFTIVSSGSSFVPFLGANDTAQTGQFVSPWTSISSSNSSVYLGSWLVRESIPEPTTALLIGGAFLVLAGRRRRPTPRCSGASR
jgi:hypothetical protein